MNFSLADIKRFVTFFETPEEGCWEWKGALGNNGYGLFQQGGHSWRAHRVSYHLINPDTDPELHICHGCDNRKCVRPSHLWAGTAAENQKDKADKGRSAKGEKNGNSKLKDEQRQIILSSSLGSRELAKRLGVTQRHVNRIRAERLS